MKSKVADRIKDLRQEKKLSQEELVKALKFSTSAIKNCEAGNRHPNHVAMWTISDFFNVSIEYLERKED